MAQKYEIASAYRELV